MVLPVYHLLYGIANIHTSYNVELPVYHLWCKIYGIAFVPAMVLLVDLVRYTSSLHTIYGTLSGEVEGEVVDIVADEVGHSSRVWHCTSRNQSIKSAILSLFSIRLTSHLFLGPKSYQKLSFSVGKFHN